MVAGALLSDNFAVLALACYIWICLDVIMGLLPLTYADVQCMASYSTIILMPMPVTATAAAETNRSEPDALPAGRFRTKSMRMMLNTRDTPKTPKSTPMPISSTSAAPTRPGQITSTTERAFGRSAPALLEAAKLPAVQPTAPDRIFRTKSIERMMLNTRDTPKTPKSTPMPMMMPFNCSYRNKNEHQLQVSGTYKARTNHVYQGE